MPRVLISIGRRYGHYINHAYGRMGTLWDGRYKSSLVQAETYLLLCQWHIELNPVRAGMVSSHADYGWSSYRANRLGRTDPLLTPHLPYLALGTDDELRCAVYGDLFRSALDDGPLNELRMALSQDQPIGNDRLNREMEAMTGQRQELRKRGRPRKRKDDGAAGDTEQAELPLGIYREFNEPGAFSAEAVGELTSVVGEHGRDLEGGGGEQAIEEGAGIAGRLGGQALYVDPAGGPIDGGEQIAAGALIGHLGQVLHIHMHEKPGS